MNIIEFQFNCKKISLQLKLHCRDAADSRRRSLDLATMKQHQISWRKQEVVKPEVGQISDHKAKICPKRPKNDQVVRSSEKGTTCVHGAKISSK